MQHEAIEAEEEERVREFQGLPVDDEEGEAPSDGSSATAGDAVPKQQQVLGVVEGQGQARSPGVGELEELARAERAAFAKAQAAKFGKDVKEATKRGEW